MKEILLSILNSYLIPALIAFLTGFMTWLGAKVKNKYDEVIKNEQVKYVVDKVVRYVEQKYKDFDSSVKYKTALEKSKEWLAQKNIEISEVELDTLIESSVYELTNAFKKNEQ